VSRFERFQSTTRGHDIDREAAPSGRLAPGARPLTQALQRKAGPSDDAAGATASDGAGGQPLPDDVRGKMEQAFGADFSGVRVRESDEAAAVGALAFTRGSEITFAPGQLDLHGQAGQELLGHELAHVVQQAGGRVAATTQHKGVAVNDDASLEREADEAGARAARGEPVGAGWQGGLAGAMVATALTGGGPAQYKVKIGGVDQPDASEVWSRIRDDQRLTDLGEAGLARARAVLGDWIRKAASYANPLRTSQNRTYASDDDLIRALSGEVRSAANLQRENGLARQVLSEASINELVGDVIAKLQTFHAATNDEGDLDRSAKRGGRYGFYYTNPMKFAVAGGRSMATVIASPPSGLAGRVAFLADYALQMREAIGDATGGWKLEMPARLDAARGGHHNPNEGADWTREARDNNAPLSAGPSATTAQLLTLAVKVGASADEKTALAWGIFAFFNKSLHLHKSGTHRFHEVMSVAAGYGVPYEAWAYPEEPPELLAL
jgi:hypothetical protein